MGQYVLSMSEAGQAADRQGWVLTSTSMEWAQRHGREGAEQDTGAVMFTMQSCYKFQIQCFQFLVPFN